MGVLRPVPIVETVRHPTAVEVVAALREFVEQSSGVDDLVLMRPDQARVLVERVDELARTLRLLADRIAGPPDDGAAVPPQDAQPSPKGTTPAKG